MTIARWRSWRGTLWVCNTYSKIVKKCKMDSYWIDINISFCVSVKWCLIRWLKKIQNNINILPCSQSIIIILQNFSIFQLLWANQGAPYRETSWMIWAWRGLRVGPPRFLFFWRLVNPSWIMSVNFSHHITRKIIRKIATDF